MSWAAMPTDIRDHALQMRVEAEAASDLREQQVRPADRISFYLRQLETVMSHLAEVAIGIGTARKRVAFRGWVLIFYADVAIERAEEGDRLHQQNEQWRRLWNSLKASIVSIRRWTGDAEKAAQLAKVNFLAAFLLARAYERDSDCGPSEEKRAFEFCAGEVPFPIDATLPLPEQLQFVSRNLDWLHEQLRCEVIWPRWW
jgi:hypothetical protein